MWCCDRGGGGGGSNCDCWAAEVEVEEVEEMGCGGGEMIRGGMTGGLSGVLNAACVARC